ncbi:TetR/AcrR family transcriptional regulator [Mycobacterium sp. 21AC1]|uniref:TetR/AcrR family transcriptional regulator n=1 Tax=[Mycobacterium] appelbergii TaxID=2939269 RepID=UPI002938EFB1|nr:TetR/AcrR family transcriptional regulator [Mycobacterium sp. 21AC1]MDV3125038.1 TetR/AcrR family transcriptional regulator [Mycobacterium sp. 21AC1]
MAAAEFAAAGYENASLNRIIASCGMSKSSFYYVIESKEALFEFVMRELIGDIAGKVSPPQLEEFDGDQFWPRVEGFFADLMAVAGQVPSALTLGRMFYSDAPGGDATASGTMMAAVQDWVHGLLRVGRSCGAVRQDLPEALQYSVILRMLQIFDEWTIAHFDEFAPEELDRLGTAQFAAIRRVLEEDQLLA